VTPLLISPIRILRLPSQPSRNIKSQFASEDAFLAQLRAEGLTLKELRAQYRDEVRNQLLKEKFIQEKLEKVHISSGEVKEFYETNRDSLPEKPAGVRLAHILISTIPGQATQDSLQRFAQLIRSKALSGDDFPLWPKAIHRIPALSTAAIWAGLPGAQWCPSLIRQLCAPAGTDFRCVRTQYGFHIIKCTGKKEDKIRVSHILIRLTPSDKDLQAKQDPGPTVFIICFKTATNFADLARQYSDDENSRDSGGELGWYSADNLMPGFKEPWPIWIPIRFPGQ